jgi:predicted phosphodiesterase
MSEQISWVHLSDLHFKAGEDYDANIVLDELLEDLARHRAGMGLFPDFVVISGDLAYSGQAEEYELVTSFLDRLLGVLGLTKDRLLLVPGNHDANLAEVSSVANMVHESLVARTQPDDFRRAVAAAVGDEYGREMLFGRLNNYRALVADFLGDDLPLDPCYGFAIKRLALAGKEVVLIGLNSSGLARGGKGDKGRLLVGERQVRAAFKQALSADLRIGVMHHPFEWLHRLDRSDVEPLMLQGCDFVLHGHLHQLAATGLSTPDARSMVLAAGACYKTRRYPNAYHWVQLDLAAGQGQLYLRRYSDKAGGFWTKDVMSYRSTEDGTWTFPLPERLTDKGPGSRLVPPEEVRVHQAYVVYTTLAHIPAFLDAPESLRPPFLLLGQGDPGYLRVQGTDRQKLELQERFAPPRAPSAGEKPREFGCFVPGMGRIVDGSGADWVLKKASAPDSHRGHVPWLVQPNWRVRLDPAALGIEDWPSDRQVEANPGLALHLYSYGLVAVCLRMPLRCGQGLLWKDFVALVKAAAPFQEIYRQPAVYTLRAGGRTRTLRAAEIVEQAMEHLANCFFESRAEYAIQPTGEARLHTAIQVQETWPEKLKAEAYHPLMAGLMEMRPNWQEVARDRAQTYRRTETGLGRLEGDWVTMNEQRLTVVAAKAHRKSKRKYLWRLHAWAELACAQAWMAQLSEFRLAAGAATEASPEWRAFWEDLTGLGRRAVRQRPHHEAFGLFSSAVGLEAVLTEFEAQHGRFLARTEDHE